MAAIALRRPLTVGASLLAGATLLVGVAHTAPMRPVLARLGRLTGSGSCPVSIANVTPQEVEAQRAKATQVLAGVSPTKRAVAGPFVLVTTTRADVDAWARAQGLTCDVQLAGTALRCHDVPAALFGTPLASDAPPASDALFRFDLEGRLVALDVMHVPARADLVTPLASALIARLERDAGPKTALHGGEIAASYFDAPGLRMTEAQFRFSDYAADVSVFRMDERGPLIVREQYRTVGAATQR